MTPPYEFDEDRRVEAVAEGRYRATITDRWNVGPVPNGGYVLSVAMAAVEHAVPDLVPVTTTAHYLRPTGPGPVDIEVEIVKEGLRLVTASARMVQAGKERVRLLTTLGPLEEGGPVHVAGEPPDVEGAAPPATTDRPLVIPVPEIGKRFDAEPVTSTAGWLFGDRGGKAELRGRVRFVDGRPPDVASLFVFADAFPPPVFAVVEPSWAPTIELTVHIRARPAPGWLRCVFRTRFLFGGYLEEDGEIWDERGQLVALSRQLAMDPSGV